jgi:hypothetical protein
MARKSRSNITLSCEHMGVVDWSNADLDRKLSSNHFFGLVSRGVPRPDSSFQSLERVSDSYHGGLYVQ